MFVLSYKQEREGQLEQDWLDVLCAQGSGCFLPHGSVKETEGRVQGLGAHELCSAGKGHL
jgi:hypothetical protein